MDDDLYACLIPINEEIQYDDKIDEWLKQFQPVKCSLFSKVLTAKIKNRKKRFKVIVIKKENNTYDFKLIFKKDS